MAYHLIPSGKMAQGAGYLADKATKESSDLAAAMLSSGSNTGTGTTTTTLAPTTTMSVAEYNLKQEQLVAAKTKVSTSFLINLICFEYSTILIYLK